MDLTPLVIRNTPYPLFPARQETGNKEGWSFLWERLAFRLPRFLNFVIVWFAGWFILGSPMATAGSGGSSVPVNVIASIERLIQAAADPNAAPIEASELEALIRFTEGEPEPGEGVSIRTYANATSALYRFDIRQSLRRILEIGYHPDIPGFIVSPSSVRIAYWKTVDGLESPFPKLWPMLDTPLHRPVLVRGIEHEEITPDQFTGTYYGYDVHRLLLLMRHHGRPVLVSVSRQKDISEVGKKGAVLGKDDDWTYLYSGEKGMNSRGLGWVDSYMYAASTIMVYDETNSGTDPRVRCTVFKWLRAGWSGINMVQTHHILAGMDRYANAFRQVVESSLLPPTEEMAQVFREIRSMGEPELRETIQHHFVRFKELAREAGSATAGFYAKYFGADGQALKRMNVEQMRSVLVLETLKTWMGKSGTQNGVRGGAGLDKSPAG